MIALKVHCYYDNKITRLKQFELYLPYSLFFYLFIFLCQYTFGTVLENQRSLWLKLSHNLLLL